MKTIGLEDLDEKKYTATEYTIYLDCEVLRMKKWWVTVSFIS